MRDNQYVDVTFSTPPDDRGNPTTFQNLLLTAADPAVIEVGAAKDAGGSDIVDTPSQAVRRCRAAGPLGMGIVLTAIAQDSDGDPLGPSTFSLDVVAQDATEIVASVGAPQNQ